MKKLVLAGVCSALLFSTTACGREDKAVPPTPPPTSSTSETTTATPEPTIKLQEFKVANYDYTYEVTCSCPDRSPITASVRDGKITKATAGNGEVINKGEPPQGADLLTIAEMLSAAEQASARGLITVDWPEGTSHPKSIFIDSILNAIDDEITYRINDFQEITEPAPSPTS